MDVPEIMAGRVVHCQSFPLFGYDLRDYEALFDEEVEHAQLVNEKTKIDWQGAVTQKHCWKKKFILVQFRIIAIVGGDRWSCREVNSEDCSGRVANCLCYYWWQSALF